MESLIGIMERYWWPLFILVVIVNISGKDIGDYGTIKGLLFAPVFIGFAYKYPKLNISYGFYIYHMVVINVLIELGITGRFVDMVLSFGVTVILAIISYVSLGKIGKRKVLHQVIKNNI